MNATAELLSAAPVDGCNCDQTTQWLAIAAGALALLSEGMGTCTHENCPNGIVDAVRRGLSSPCLRAYLSNRSNPSRAPQSGDLPF